MSILKACLAALGLFLVAPWVLLALCRYADWVAQFFGVHP